MSLHQSLRAGGRLLKHRNVLSKRERIEKLLDTGKWTEEDARALGLPKVRNIKLTGKKGGKKKEAEETLEAGEETPGAADAATAPQDASTKE